MASSSAEAQTLADFQKANDDLTTANDELRTRISVMDADITNACSLEELREGRALNADAGGASGEDQDGFGRSDVPPEMPHFALHIFSWLHQLVLGLLVDRVMAPILLYFVEETKEALQNPTNSAFLSIKVLIKILKGILDYLKDLVDAVGLSGPSTTPPLTYKGFPPVLVNLLLVLHNEMLRLKVAAVRGQGVANSVMPSIVPSLVPAHMRSAVKALHASDGSGSGSGPRRGGYNGSRNRGGGRGGRGRGSGSGSGDRSSSSSRGGRGGDRGNQGK